MFISPAYAQSSLFGDNSGTVALLGQFLLIGVVFWFFLFRPQQQKAKEHKAMLAALRRGDRIVTGGGIIGTVAKVVSDDEVMVDIAEGMRVRVLRSTISSVLAKTEPVPAKADKGDDKDAPEEAEAGAEKGKGGRRASGRN
jgi:preprotein translocase subunit YajC